MSSVCTIPALLKLFFGHPPEKETVLKEEKTEENKLQKRPLWFRCVWVLISLIAVLFQVHILFLFLECNTVAMNK